MVEQWFGLLKSRFRCIDKTGGTLCYSLSFCCQIIVAVCILHNICINRRIPFVDEMLVDDSDDEVLEVHGEEITGIRVRQELIMQYFTV